MKIKERTYRLSLYSWIKRWCRIVHVDSYETKQIQSKAMSLTTTKKNSHELDKGSSQYSWRHSSTIFSVHSIFAEFRWSVHIHSTSQSSSCCVIPLVFNCRNVGKKQSRWENWRASLWRVLVLFESYLKEMHYHTFPIHLFTITRDRSIDV